MVDVFSEPIERAAWGIRHIDAPFPNETSNALALTVARSKILSMLVSEKVPVAAQHVNTAVVATDMLSIVKAHGFGMEFFQQPTTAYFNGRQVTILGFLLWIRFGKHVCD